MFDCITEDVRAGVAGGLSGIAMGGAYHGTGTAKTQQEKTPASNIGEKADPLSAGVRYMASGTKNDNEGWSVKEQIKNHSAELDAMDPVFSDEVHVSNQGKAKSKGWILPILEKRNYRVRRQDIGEIVFDKKRVNMSLNYLKNDGELAAYAALPNVLEHGRTISNRDDHKGRGYGTVTIAAPVEINGIRGNMAAVVRLNDTGNYYKVHRILMPDGTQFVYENEKSTAEPAGAATNGAVTSPTDSASFCNMVS